MRQILRVIVALFAVAALTCVRRSIDDDSYSIRFTPRKQRSNWSAINVARVSELTAG